MSHCPSCCALYGQLYRDSLSSVVDISQEGSKHVHILLVFSMAWSPQLVTNLVLNIAPADSVISYKTTVFTPGMPDNLSPYQGEPTPENNKLWEDLYVGKKQVNPSKKTSLTRQGLGHLEWQKKRLKGWLTRLTNCLRPMVITLSP